MKALRAVPALALVACSLGTAPSAPEGSLKVLFIGNSLTYENDLPRTVADLALSAGVAPCYCYQIAYPNYALEDHWDNREAVTALREATWDFVVMQQGPSALPSSRAHLILWATVWAQLIDSAGAQAVMYGVWPSVDRLFDFPNVADSYRAAADSIGALFAPAGEAWQQAWARDSTLPLYAADGFHPSPMGTYLAALMVFQRLYQHSPVDVQASAVVDGRVQAWPPATVRLLQEAAAAANAAEDARAARKSSAASVRRRR
jgi:hypothetical protein